MKTMIFWRDNWIHMMLCVTSRSVYLCLNSFCSLHNRFLNIFLLVHIWTIQSEVCPLTAWISSYRHVLWGGGGVLGLRPEGPRRQWDGDTQVFSWLDMETTGALALLSTHSQRHTHPCTQPRILFSLSFPLSPAQGSPLVSPCFLNSNMLSLSLF